MKNVPTENLGFPKDKSTRMREFFSTLCKKQRIPSGEMVVKKAWGAFPAVAAGASLEDPVKTSDVKWYNSINQGEYGIENSDRHSARYIASFTITTTSPTS